MICYYERLKDRIIRSLDVRNLAMMHPGEYLYDHTLQMLGLLDSSGRLSVYNRSDVLDGFRRFVEECDIRRINELMEFAKLCGISSIPSWAINGNFVVDLSEKGWALYRKTSVC